MPASRRGRRAPGVRYRATDGRHRHDEGGRHHPTGRLPDDDRRSDQPNHPTRDAGHGTDPFPGPRPATDRTDRRHAEPGANSTARRHVRRTSPDAPDPDRRWVGRRTNAPGPPHAALRDGNQVLARRRSHASSHRDASRPAGRHPQARHENRCSADRRPTPIRGPPDRNPPAVAHANGLRHRRIPQPERAGPDRHRRELGEHRPTRIRRRDRRPDAHPPTAELRRPSELRRRLDRADSMHRCDRPRSVGLRRPCAVRLRLLRGADDEEKVHVQA